jgi:hypothetical protein
MYVVCQKVKGKTLRVVGGLHTAKIEVVYDRLNSWFYYLGVLVLRGKGKNLYLLLVGLIL